MGLGKYFRIFLAGTITGILIAPDKGKKTREELKRYYGDAKKDFEKYWDKSSKYVKEGMDKVKSFGK